MKNQGFTLNNPILIAFCRNSSKSSCRLFVCKCSSETVRIRKYNVLFKLGGVTCTTFFLSFNYLNRVAKHPGILAAKCATRSWGFVEQYYAVKNYLIFLFHRSSVFLHGAYADRFHVFSHEIFVVVHCPPYFLKKDTNLLHDMYSDRPA